MSKRPKLLFDLSEVLIRGVYGIEHHIAELEGRDVKETSALTSGPRLWALCRGEITEAEYLSGVCREGRWTKVNERYLGEVLREQFKTVMTGMPDYITELSQRADLYLLSDHAREWVPGILEYHRFLSHFTRRYFSYDLRANKREGTPFASVLADLAIQPSEIHFIDDWDKNITCAAGYGIQGTVFQSRASLQPVLETWLAAN